MSVAFLKIQAVTVLLLMIHFSTWMELRKCTEFPRNVKNDLIQVILENLTQNWK